MADRIEDVLGKITELTNAVREHPVGDATFDSKAVEAQLTAFLDEYRATLADNAPARPGAFVSTPIQRAAAQYRGKYTRELNDIAATGEHRVGNWKVKGSDFIFAKHLLDRAAELKVGNVKPASEDLNAVVKTLTSTGSATGDEYVPTGMAGELWDDFFMASRVAADLPTVPMPTDPYDDPLGFGDITWRKGTQGSATTSTNMATAKSTLTSTEQVAEVDWTYTLDEDAVIAMMPALRARLAISGGEQMDAFCLSACSTATSTGNINLDDDTPSADAWYLTDGQNGIRHLWLVDNTSQTVAGGGAVLSDAMMTSMFAKMGKYALSPQNCRIVPGSAVYMQMVRLSNVATVDKYGAAATILSGELGRYSGVPIIPSASQPLGEADGKVCKTAGSNTLGTCSAYNRTGWKLGFRRGLMIEVDRNIQTRQMYMVVSFRIAIAAYGTRSSAKHAAGIVNILV